MFNVYQCFCFFLTKKVQLNDMQSELRREQSKYRQAEVELKQAEDKSSKSTSLEKQVFFF